MKLLGFNHKLIFVILCSFLIISCGSRPIAYGVVLWADENGQVENGELVEILSRSRLNETYTIRPIEEKEKISLEQWRVNYFEDREEAKRFAAEYRRFKTVYAKADMHALPVRENANRLSARVYKLREDEVMKVLGRSEEKSDEAGFEDYWWKVLTEQGTTGYCFGYYLNIYDTRQEESKNTVDHSQDPQLVKFFENVWRPTYFQEMIDNNTVDLSRFRQEIGLFPNREDKRIELQLLQKATTFNYSEVYKANRSTYVFEDTSLQVIVINEREISIQYSLNGEQYSAALMTLNRSVQEVIAEEVQRRNEEYQYFLDQASRLHSTAYGTIELMEENSFRWSNFGRLVPSIIPAGVSGNGEVNFHMFLSDQLEDSYDGVISFHFTGMRRNEYIHFLYSFTTGGVRFEYAPSQNTNEHIVVNRSSSPLHIFFTFR